MKHRNLHEIVSALTVQCVRDETFHHPHHIRLDPDSFAWLECSAPVTAFDVGPDGRTAWNGVPVYIEVPIVEGHLADDAPQHIILVGSATEPTVAPRIPPRTKEFVWEPEEDRPRWRMSFLSWRAIYYAIAGALIGAGIAWVLS